MIEIEETKVWGSQVQDAWTVRPRMMRHFTPVKARRVRKHGLAGSSVLITVVLLGTEQPYPGQPPSQALAKSSMYDH